MPVFDAESLYRIKTWNQTLEKKINIRLVSTNHPEAPRFETIADQLNTHAPNLTIATEKGEKGLPGFVITDSIFFHAFPLEKELDPFLSTLSLLAHKNEEPANPLRTDLKKITIPVRLKLYIALHCPHCPGMVNTLIPLALENPNIILEIIDGSLFVDTAQKDKVLSAPCLILDDGFRWTGSVAPEEIIKMCANRDPSQLSAATFQTILEQGDASWIAQEMIQKETIFDGFIALLLHETWSVRLGAMVVVEELTEDAPDLAGSLCPTLMSAFKKKATPIRGDILYALGEAGTADTKDWIKKQLTSFEHPDLVDAAKEALETLEERHG